DAPQPPHALGQARPAPGAAWRRAAPLHAHRARRRSEARQGQRRHAAPGAHGLTTPRIHKFVSSKIWNLTAKFLAPPLSCYLTRSKEDAVGRRHAFTLVETLVAIAMIA